MAERPTHIGIRHVAFRVEAYEKMKQFYVELLGFRVEWEPDPDNVYLTSGTDNLALHRATSAPSRQAGPLDHIGIIVSSAEDVDFWADFLETKGVSLVRRPRTHRDGARSCYVKDPDGNQIQIIHHPPICKL